jgi:hypothetical protein
MALASNMKRQLARKLTDDMTALNPAYTVAAQDTAAGDPSLLISTGGVAIAAMQIKRRAFIGFNIVAELSSSAGEGFPEHECWLVVKSTQDPLTVAQLMKAADLAGCSVVKFGEVTAAPALADLIDANIVAEIANNPRMGQTGV